MKRSLFIAIAVLIVMALFVGCKAEIADRDELVEVTIDGGARAISTTGTSTVQGVESLYWYYVAEKNDNGRFSTGATTWKAVSTDPGLAGASLGKFSTGFWKFSFYGYAAPVDEKPETPASTAIYMCTGMSVKLDGTVAAPKLTVKLDFAGEVSNGQVTFGAITFAGTAEYKVEVFEGNEKIAESAFVPADTNDSASMTPAYLTDSYAFTEGDHTLTIKVTERITDNDSNEHIDYIVSEEDVTFKLQKGIKITISGSATASDVTYVVNVDGTVTQASALVTVNNSAAVNVTANVTPAESGVSTVSFPAESLEDGAYSLDVVVSGAESSFTISDEAQAQGVAVAGIDLTLSSGDTTITTFNDKYVTVTTYVAKGLVSPKVYYGSEQMEVLNYDATTGELIFKTPHFSEFIVISSGIEAINVTTNIAYDSIVSAIDAAKSNQTVKMMKDVTLSEGIAFNRGRSGLVLDLGGNTLTVGSGYSYVYSDSVTIKNGLLTSVCPEDKDWSTIEVIGHSSQGVYSTGLTVAEDGVIGGPKFAIAVFGASGSAAYDATINVFGKLTNNIFVSGNIHEGNIVINVKDGAEINTTGIGIALNGFATVNIEDGAAITSEEATAIEVRAGNLNITGGTLTSNAVPTSFEPNGNGTTTKGVAVAISQHTTVLPITVNISGGEFYGYNALWQRDVQNNGSEGLAKISLTVTGGVFKSRLADENPAAIYIEDSAKLGHYEISDNITTSTWFTATAEPVTGIPENPPAIPIP